MNGSTHGRLVFGILGDRLSHSLSPAMFTAILNEVAPGTAYIPFEVEAGQLGTMLSALKLLNAGGFNVTIPFKALIIPHLHKIDAEAAAIGAVNCVDVRDDFMTGYNTDWAAFKETLGGVHLQGASALVLGAGGAARAVVHALRSLGAAGIAFAARRAEAVEGDAHFEGTTFVPFDEPSLTRAAAGSSLVVNTTPLGMFPDVGSCPLATGFHAGQIVYDLVYRPRPTRFLQYAAAAGARTIDGLEMLARQAAAALNIWTGCRVSWQKFQAIAERELRKY